MQIPTSQRVSCRLGGRKIGERTLPVIGRTSLIRAFELSRAVAQSSTGDVKKTVLRAWRIDLAAESLSSPKRLPKATNKSLLQSWNVIETVSLSLE